MYPLRIVKHPLALPKMGVKATWHVRVDRDPAVLQLRRWLREIFAEAG